MPRQLKLGGTEVIVKTLEIDGNRIEQLSLDEILRQGGSESDVPATLKNITSTNVTLTDEPDNSLLFSSNGRVTGTSSIIHDKTNRNTSFLGKINVIGNLNVDKQDGDTDVGVVVDNNHSNVGVTVGDNDILSLSYVNKTTKRPLDNSNLPVKIFGTLETTSNLNVGKTLRIDDINNVTTINGDVNMNRINFNENNLYLSGGSSISSQYNSGIITINLNNAIFGRTVVSGTPSSGDTLSGFIIQNQIVNSRVHGVLNIDQDNVTLSGTFSNVLNEKNSPPLTLTTGDKFFFTIENLNGHNFFSYKIFS